MQHKDIMSHKAYQIVMTQGISEYLETDQELHQNRNGTRKKSFAWCLNDALQRFVKSDWGNIYGEDRKTNNMMVRHFDKGGEYGQILGSYEYNNADLGELFTDSIYEYDHPKFWIIRDSERVTILFPNEY